MNVHTTRHHLTHLSSGWYWLYVVAVLVFVSLVDLSHWPESPAVLVYGALLFTLELALVFLIYRHFRKSAPEE